MLSFQRIFQTRQQAMDVYKTQLSSQKLYVESFEGYPKGTPATVNLEIRETHQKIALSGSVERLVGKTEAVELGFGQRPGLLLNLPITQDIIEPLRAFFLAQAPKPAAPAAQTAPAKPAIPLENVTKLPIEAAIAQVDTFLELADNGNLYQLFYVRPDVDRKTLRGIYNTVVRMLHPDAHDSEFNADLSAKLGEAYQVINEAYKILQHPVQSAIYMDISRVNRMFNGMSLNAYKKWMADYRLKNASQIRMSDELAAKAEDDLAKGDKDKAAQNIQLALKYDPYNEAARSIQL